MRNCVTVNPGDAKYNELVNLIDNANDDNLMIVARSEANRKDDRIKPIAVINGIYFYVANNVGDGIVYKSDINANDIAKAVQNTINNAVIGNIWTIMFGDGVPIDEYELEDMNILTNIGKNNGAGILFCTKFLSRIKEKFGTDFYIIPSSIHEVMIVPFGDGITLESVTEIINVVNVNCVDDADYLGDHPWTIDEWLN